MAIGKGAMAIQRQEQAVREKLVGYVFLASLAAVIAFIVQSYRDVLREFGPTQHRGMKRACLLDERPASETC